MSLLHDLQQLQPVEPRPLHPDVEKQQMRPPRGYRFKRLVSVARGARAVALVGKNARHAFANISLVVDDQNVGRHSQPLLCNIGARVRPIGQSARGKMKTHPGALSRRRVEQIDAAAMFLENFRDNG